MTVLAWPVDPTLGFRLWSFRVHDQMKGECLLYPGVVHFLSVDELKEIKVMDSATN
jgi:hypothetical protein